MLFTVEDVKRQLELFQEYLFSASPLYHREVFSLLTTEATNLFHVSLKFIYSLSTVTFYLLIHLLKLVTISIPYILVTIDAIVYFHRTQLTPSDIALEVFLIITSCVIFYYRRAIKHRYKAIETYISAKSKATAKVLPHFCFFSLSLVIGRLGSKFFSPLASTNIMPLFTLLSPLLMSRPSLFALEEDTHSPRLLITWTVLCFYHAIATLLTSLPFTHYLQYYTPSLREISLVILVWTQISPVFAHIVYEASQPLFHLLQRRLPSVDLGIIRLIDYTSTFLIRRGIPAFYIDILKGFLLDTYALVLTIVFCCTPTAFANFGVALIALVLPLMRSYEVLHNHHKALASKTKHKTPTDNKPMLFMVHYWICFALLWLAKLYFIALWPSTTMLLCLYLQNSFLHGATAVLNETKALIQTLVDRNGRVPLDAYNTPDATPVVDKKSIAFTGGKTARTETFATPLEDADADVGELEPRNLTQELDEEPVGVLSEEKSPVRNMRRRKASRTTL